MSITLNGTEGVTLDNGSADGAQVTLKSSGYSDWNLDNYSGRFRAYYNATEYFTINSSGNVGIGTSAPNSGANVGALSVQTTQNFGMSIYRSATSPSQIAFLDNNNSCALGTDGNSNMVFYNNSRTTERMRIDSSGNVQIGRTSSLVGFSKNLTIGNGTNSVEFNPDRTYFDASAYYILNTSAAGVKLTNGATSWTAQSDERLKDIIEPIENASYKVSTLRAVIGKYKTDEEGTRRSFLIAQDVDAVLPEAVDKSNPDELGVRYTETIPLLVAAIQEQQELIKSLTSRIETLEAK